MKGLEIPRKLSIQHCINTDAGTHHPAHPCRFTAWNREPQCLCREDARDPSCSHGQQSLTEVDIADGEPDGPARAMPLRTLFGKRTGLVAAGQRYARIDGAATWPIRTWDRENLGADGCRGETMAGFRQVSGQIP